MENNYTRHGHNLTFLSEVARSETGHSEYKQSMIYFVPAIGIFLIQVYLLFSWWRSRKKMDGKEKLYVLWGFLLGQIYLIWEVVLVKQIGKPLPGSPEQKLLMARLLLGGSLGGLFVMMGLIYLSFASFGQSKN